MVGGEVAMVRRNDYTSVVQSPVITPSVPGHLIQNGDPNHHRIISYHNMKAWFNTMVVFTTRISGNHGMVYRYVQNRIVVAS